MTAAATRQVAVDWQVEARPATRPGRRADRRPGRPHVQGGASRSASPTRPACRRPPASPTRRPPAPGVVVGLPDGYAATFPGELRVLTGDPRGVLLAQQTAANLHAGPGDTVTVALAGLPPVNAAGRRGRRPAPGRLAVPEGRRAGRLPSLGAARQRRWCCPPAGGTRSSTRSAAARPDLVRDPGPRPARPPAAPRPGGRLQPGRRRRPPPRGGRWPAAARSATTSAPPSTPPARTPCTPRSCSSCSACPGVVLAGLLTATVAACRRRPPAPGPGPAAGPRRHRCRPWSAPPAAEAAAVALVGAAVGLVRGGLVGRAEFGSATFGASTGSAVVWARGVGAGRRRGRRPRPWSSRRGATPARLTVATARQVVGPRRRPRWLRGGLDIVAAGRRRAGVLADQPLRLPDRAGSRGAADAVGQLLGAGRAAAVLGRVAGCWPGGWPTPSSAGAGGSVTAAARPVAGGLVPARSPPPWPGTAAAWPGRSPWSPSRSRSPPRPRCSTPPTTSRPASTPGSPTAPTSPSPTRPPPPAPPTQAATIAAVPGVRHVEPLLHRFAYVGADLQDLFGVRPATVVAAGQAAGRLLHGRQRAGPDRPPGPPARRPAGQRRDGEGLPAHTRRPTPPAGAGQRAAGS